MSARGPSLARSLAANAALYGALALAVGAFEAWRFDKVHRPVWLALDVAGALALGGFAWLRRRDLSARRELAGARFLFLALVLVVVSAAITTHLHATLRPRIPVVVDAPYPGPADAPSYVAMLRGGLGAEARYPFNTRWLTPLLAGDLNVLASRDVAALESLNFVGLVLAATLLGVALLRVGAAPLLAGCAPFFLLFSYLGTYAARVRLLTDPVAYAFHAACLACVVHRRSRPLAWVVMTVGVLGSEKLLAWAPVLVVFHLLDWRDGRAGAGAFLRRAAVQTLPAVGLVALLHALAPKGDAHQVWWPEKAALFRMTPEADAIFFPFGVTSVLALAACARLSRTMLVVGTVLVPLYAQLVLATDTQRMTAYAFAFWIPAGLLYLQHGVAVLPRLVGYAPALLLTWLHVQRPRSPWVPAALFATIVVVELADRRRGREA